MSFYTCFDWFKKLRLFVNERNLKIDVVLKASRAVVIRWCCLNEAPLGLSKFMSVYLPYFEKMNIPVFFNIIANKFELICKDWSKLFVRFIRNNLNHAVHTLVQPDWGYFFMNRTQIAINPYVIKWKPNYTSYNLRNIVLRKPWCCLSFDLRILTTPLVSSSSF
jgi:hypothetical protein